MSTDSTSAIPLIGITIAATVMPIAIAHRFDAFRRIQDRLDAPKALIWVAGRALARCQVAAATRASIRPPECPPVLGPPPLPPRDLRRRISAAIAMRQPASRTD